MRKLKSRGRSSEAVSRMTRMVAQGIWCSRQMLQMIWDSISTASAWVDSQRARFSVAVEATRLAQWKRAGSAAAARRRGWRCGASSQEKRTVPRERSGLRAPAKPQVKTKRNDGILESWNDGVM